MLSSGRSVNDTQTSFALHQVADFYKAPVANAFGEAPPPIFRTLSDSDSAIASTGEIMGLVLLLNKPHSAASTGGVRSATQGAPALGA